MEFLLLFLLKFLIIISFILRELAKMSPLGWHPPQLLSIQGTSIDNSVGVLDFFLFCVHLFVYVSIALCVCASVFSYSQVFKCEPGYWVRIYKVQIAYQNA